jgi:hypothetical protein
LACTKTHKQIPHLLSSSLKLLLLLPLLLLIQVALSAAAHAAGTCSDLQPSCNITAATAAEAATAHSACASCQSLSGHLLSAAADAATTMSVRMQCSGHQVQITVVPALKRYYCQSQAKKCKDIMRFKGVYL